MHTYVSSKVRAAFIYFHFEFFKLQRSRSKSLIDLNGRQYSVNSKFGNTFYLNFEPERSNQQDFYAFYDWTQAEKKFWNFTLDYFIKPCIVNCNSNGLQMIFSKQAIKLSFLYQLPILKYLIVFSFLDILYFQIYHWPRANIWYYLCT